MSFYFQDLNYSCANEDSTLEYTIAKNNHSKFILAIGGSGSRSLPFLALPIDRLHIVDISKTQLDFISFKLETIKQLERDDCIKLWTTENSFEREQIFKKITLEHRVQNLILNLMKRHKEPILYWGKWERTFIFFSKIVRIFFSSKTLIDFFESHDSFQFYQKQINGMKWKLLLKIIGNKTMFNSLLYRGSFIKKNSKLSYFDYYYQAFERLFKLNPKKSHFLQLCFLGKIKYQEGLPIEFYPDIFDKIKKSQITPTFENGSILNILDDGTHFDFVSLSDVPSYFSGEEEVQYLKKISKRLYPKGVIINRYYLRKPENTISDDYINITNQFSSLISHEHVQMYELDIYQKIHEI